MIGLVIVAHGGFAQELLNAAEHVVGPLPGAAAIGLGPKDDMAKRRAEVERAVAEVNDGDGVVILTDLFGGSPSNLAIATMGSMEGVDVVTGANLPMMMKLAKTRTGARRDAVAAAVEAGRRYILDARELLEDNEGAR
ncbi:MAG: PTS sugar transporter subunit IIA [Pseudomonadota bacterium]